MSEELKRKQDVEGHAIGWNVNETVVEDEPEAETVVDAEAEAEADVEGHSGGSWGRI